MDRDLEPGAKYNAMCLAEGWAGLCDRTLAFRRPELAALGALWRQLAGAATVPRRADLSPRLLKEHLPHVAIYERLKIESRYSYRVRLMGTQFAQVMGDLTGKFLDKALPQQFVPRWNAALDAVLDSGVPLRFVSRSDTANKSYLVGEYFEAPLLGDDGSMNLVIAAGIFTAADDWRNILAGIASTSHIGGVPV